MSRLNLTFPTGQVLQALASGFHYGFDIMDATGLPSGTVYPILRRLDGEGLLESTWEKHAAAQKAVRPPRRYYAITSAGQRMLAAATARYPLLSQSVGRDVRGLKPSRA
jgi:PadR family transcriptional regulator, regulatory protein PadR